VNDEVQRLKDIIDKQAEHLKKYEEQYKKLFKEVERLKEELLKYRGY
jgi:phage host-nuclease inhibitor protein Gam